MNGYLVFYEGKKLEVHADSLYEAKKKALEVLKPPKKKLGLLAVVLAEKAGVPVVHHPAEFGA